LLGPQTAFTGGLGGQRGPTRAVGPESLVEAFRQALQGQLAVANLRALIGHDDAQCHAELLEEAGPLARAENTRAGDVEDQFHPRIGGIRVLTARPTARAKTPLQLGYRDDQMTVADPQAACRERQPWSGSGRGQRSHERKATFDSGLAQTAPYLGAYDPSNDGAHNWADEGDRHHGAKKTSARHCPRHSPRGTACLARCSKSSSTAHLLLVCGQPNRSPSERDRPPAGLLKWDQTRNGNYPGSRRPGQKQAPTLRLRRFMPITLKMLERAVEASHRNEPASDMGHFAPRMRGLALVLE